MKVANRVRERTLQDCIVLDDAVAADLAVANAAVTAAVDIVFAGRKGDRKMFFGSFWAGPVLWFYEFSWSNEWNGLPCWTSKWYHEAAPSQMWERINGYGKWNPDDALLVLTWEATWEEQAGLNAPGVEQLHGALARRRSITSRQDVIRVEIQRALSEKLEAKMGYGGYRQVPTQTRVMVGDTLFVLGANGDLVRGDPDKYETVDPQTPYSRGIWGSDTLRNRQYRALKRQGE
jgi:hypothetical protein